MPRPSLRLFIALILPAIVLLAAWAIIAPPQSAQAEAQPIAQNDRAKDHHAGDKPAETEEDGEWIVMFNGEDLTGWTPKFAGYDLGVNYKDTFRVVDGKLVVSYDNWDQWNGEFGHLFYETEFSHYIMRVEYRFVGEQVKGGPGWANFNNGIMFHGQPAETMGKDQDFPISIEAQFSGSQGRGTGNICTPGTHVTVNGELTTQHVINANGPELPNGEWITYEIEVHGSEKAIHRINGEVVIEYGPLVIDDRTDSGKAEIERRGTKDLATGTISLQAETAPIEFRNIRIKVLEE